MSIITNCNIDGAGAFASAHHARRVESTTFIVSSFSNPTREYLQRNGFRRAKSRETENRKSRFGKMLSRSKLIDLFDNVEIEMRDDFEWTQPGMVLRTGAELKAAREASVLRFLAIASAIKLEAGVTEHIIRKGLSGYAFSSGKIEAPEGRTRKQLYILAHECGHIALKHFERRQPRHVEEMQAEKWAHEALRRHGVSVPRAMTKRAKKYVARKINQAKRRGAKKIDGSAARYAFG